MAVADPFAPIFALGKRQVRLGLVLGIVGTLLLHGATATRVVTALIDLGIFTSKMRALIVDRLRAQYDIDFTPPPEIKPPPEPEPEKQPEPQPKLRAAAPSTPPPAPAEAAKVLTSDKPEDGPVDLTGWGIVSGEAQSFPGGQTSNKGTSTRPVAAKPVATGTPNATGTTPGPAAAPEKDLSRVARPTDLGTWQNCGFPAEADMEQINFAKVVLVVTVGADGRPKKVDVLADPGNGFGKQARQCAMRKQYTPGLDRGGQPITTSTPPITVRFVR